MPRIELTGPTDIAAGEDWEARLDGLIAQSGAVVFCRLAGSGQVQAVHLGGGTGR